MRRPSSPPLAAALLLAAALAPAPAAPPAPDAVDRAVDAAMPAVLELRRRIHAYPELANREVRTARTVAERLRALGVDVVETGVAHTGVVGVIRGRSRDRVVALRADMDALPVREETGLPYASKVPGRMHACGHDSHVASLLGAADVLTANRDLLAGDVVLLFQPAEEGPPEGEEGGAALMVKEGVLRDRGVEAIFGLHAFPDVDTGQLGYGLRGVMASVDKLDVLVRGEQVHAAYPWKGRDPVVAAAAIVTALQTVVSRALDARQSAVVSLGVVEGGQRWNIIPSEVRLEGTLRALDAGVRQRAQEEIRRIVTRVAEAHGCTATVEIHDHAPVTWNDPELGARMLPTLQRVVGEEDVVPVLPSLGGEDFAFYAQEIPGFFFRLGMRDPSEGAVHALHTPRFRVDEDALPHGVEALARLALDYLHGPPMAPRR